MAVGARDARRPRHGAGAGTGSRGTPSGSRMPSRGSSRLPVLIESRDGYRNLCRLLTRMKLRAPKGEGALTLDEIDGHVGGLIALGRARRAQRRAVRRRRAGRSAGRRVRPRRRLPRAAAPPPARRGVGQPRAARSRRGVPRAGPRDQRRPLRRAGRSPALRRPHLHPPQDDAGAGGTAADAATPSAISRRRRRWRSCSPTCREALAGARELADRLDYTMADLGYRFPGVSGAGGRDDGVVPAQDHAGGRARALPADPSRARAADRARAGSDREARSRRLLPDRLGHRQLLPAGADPRAGARLGGQQRRLLQPRHHRRRSDRDGSAVRAVPVGGARRVAGHRSRSAERRSPRARHSARLREVRQVPPWTRGAPGPRSR